VKQYGHARWEELELGAADIAAGIGRVRRIAAAVDEEGCDNIEIMYACERLE